MIVLSILDNILSSGSMITSFILLSFSILLVNKFIRG